MRSIAYVLTAILFLGGCVTGPRSAHAPTTIPWETAEQLVLAGQVVELEPRSDGTVRLHLVDGRHLVTNAPGDAEARRLVERCGEPCAGVKIRER